MAKQKKGYIIYDLQEFDNTHFLCLNCGTVLWVPLNVKGEGRTTCPRCHHDSSVKRYRRKLQVTIYDDIKQPIYTDDYDLSVGIG